VAVRLNLTTKLVAMAAGTMIGTYMATKRAMVKRCKKVVTRECNDVLVVPESFCRDKAREICEG
jgi:hypothetical protein